MAEKKPTSIVFDTKEEYIQRAEQLTDMDFPENYYCTVEPVNDEYDGTYYYWEALLEYRAIEEITDFVHEDPRWINSDSIDASQLIPDWYPEDEDIWDRVAIYNIDTDQWNTVPDDGEEYHYIAFLWYQSGEMLLMMEYEM